MSAPARPGQVLAIVCAGIVLANLDLFIVNLALPSIGQELDCPDLGTLSWILNGYAIVYAALLVFCGRLAERYPRNHSFLLGIGIFTAASAACALANSVELLIGFRLLQAAGAALLTPTSIGLILATFPAERRASAVRIWAAVGGFAAALGPLVGGLLVAISWRWIFLVNVPIGLLALRVGWIKLPKVSGHDVPAPYLWAAVLVTAGIGVLTFGIVQLNDWGWNSPGVLLSFAAAIVLLALFVAHCLRSANPFIDPALFRIRDFTGACLITAPFSMAFGALLLSRVLWEQGVWNWSAMKVGLSIAPGPLMVPVTSLLVAGGLIRRFGAASVIAAGLVIFAGNLAVWTVLAGPHPDLWLALLTIMAPVGVGLTVPTLMGVGTSALPGSSFATGSGALNMIRQTGFAFGVAAFVAIVGSPGSALAQLAAFDRAWWVMTGIGAFGLVPLLLLLLRRPAPTVAKAAQIGADSTLVPQSAPKPL